jgi:hypothetical protein
MPSFAMFWVHAGAVIPDGDLWAIRLLSEIYSPLLLLESTVIVWRYHAAGAIILCRWRSPLGE